MAKIQTNQHNQILAKKHGHRNSHSLLLAMQCGTKSLEDWQLLINLNPVLPQNLGIILLGIYPVQMKTFPPNIYSGIFLPTLCISQNWEQSRCPSIGEHIKKLWHIHTREYYAVIKRSKLSSHEKAWRNLKCIFLGERS